jgi:hypothetical protein
MTIEYAALVIGAFLIVVILIWIKLRFMDARLRKMQKELKQLKEFHILYNRHFMTAMIQGGEGHKSHAEVIALVPPSNPVEAQQQTSDPGIVG